MKKLFFLLFVVLSCLSARAQIQRPFPDSSAYWVWEHIMQNSAGTGIQRTYYTYYISGDTTINNLVYHKLYNKYFNLNLGWLVGVFRKDSLKVYYLDFSIYEEPTWRDDCDSSECLLYDFGLQVGDSIFQVRLDSLDHFLKVTQIDTISINGENLKKWTLSSSIDPLFDMVWIEGIGSLLPIFQYYPFFESGTSLLCFYEGNVFYEVVFDFLFCLRLGSEELINNFKVELYPNPAQNEVNIRFLSFHAGQKELVLYNNLGQKLKSINTDKNELQIDLSEYQNGFYFLKVSTRDQSEEYKFIVSN